ncbi:MAG: 30S ribosomal protein S6 [Planctomycetaceae bacterium]|nr:30S ribosomal protein S6 [Planctomycetaceae bacterium]
MAVNNYECMLILDSNRYVRDQAGVSGQIAKFVEKCGGEMLVSRLWEERRLAYPIAGNRKGTYWLSYFKVESTQIPAIERECQLSESILRTLIIKIDPRITETLVKHALGEVARPRPAAVATPAPPREAVGVVAEEEEGVDALADE